MIIRETKVAIEEENINKDFVHNGKRYLYKQTLFFDLEHYIYIKPICIGVFGCCHFNESENVLEVTQYMIESKNEIYELLLLAKKYFSKMYSTDKRYIVTFSGNNDFTVIKYLFQKYEINFDFEVFEKIDIQELYKKYTGQCIGLKNLEKRFDIKREGENISGINLAKTFRKIVKDGDYINRMPKEKINNILIYNEQDVVNLYQILNGWDKFISLEIENISKEQKEKEVPN